MRVGIMTTNYGSHPPDKWAEQTAFWICDMIVVPDDGPSDSEAVRANRAKFRKAKPRLELDLADALEDHHAKVQDHEWDRVNEDPKQLHTELEPHDLHVQETLDKIAAVTSKSVFAKEFQREDIKEYVKAVVLQHFRTVMDIERSWYATENPHDENSKLYQSNKVGV